MKNKVSLIVINNFDYSFVDIRRYIDDYIHHHSSDKFHPKVFNFDSDSYFLFLIDKNLQKRKFDFILINTNDLPRLFY